MTDWKKTYSVWFNTILVIAGIVTAVVEYFQGLDPTTPAIVAVVGAVTIVLRRIPQTPAPEKDRIRIVSERGWVPLYLLPLVALFAFVTLYLIACTRTPAEAADRENCLADALARSNRRSDVECIQAGYAWDAEHRAKLVAEAQEAGDKAAEQEAAALELCPTNADIMAELTKKQEACR